MGTDAHGLMAGARQLLNAPNGQDDSRRLTLSGVVDGFADVQQQFRDLDFFDPGGTLELRRRVRSVVSLRIELPKTEFLHLASVLIDADGVTPVAQQPKIAVSSSWQIYREALDSGLLFDPDNRDVVLHTNRDNRPWAEISFKRPVDISRILLRNRNDARSVRARGILVLARTRDGSWTTIYDGSLRERQFALAVERRYAGQVLADRAASVVSRTWGRPAASSADPPVPPMSRSVGADLTRVLTAIRLQDFTNVQADFRRLGLPDDVSQALKAEINSKLLAPRQLEWSTHGVRKTFRFWSREEKQHYIDFSRSVIDCLTSVNANVCFGFGSVLSIVRDHDLIPHDDDLDVIIGFEPSQASTLAEALKIVRKHLNDNGFVAYGTSPANLNIRDRENFKKLDVFVGIFEGDNIAWYPGKRGSLTRDMIFPAVDLDLLDRPCPVPRETDRYLHELYGDGWKTPDPNFHHPFGQRKAEYKDIQG